MLIEELDGAINPYALKIDNLCMLGGFTRERQYFETGLKMDEICEVKYDDECISDEDKFELMQQKELIDRLINGREV